MTNAWGTFAYGTEEYAGPPVANPLYVSINQGRFPYRIYEIAFGYGPNDPNPVWVDVTRDVLDCSSRRGRQRTLSKFEAGSFNLTLDNKTGKYSPFNGSGPYAGLIRPGMPIRFRAVWGTVTYSVFTGYVESWPLTWPSASDSTVAITAIDYAKFMALKNPTSVNMYGPAVQADTPIGWWRLNETTGTTVADSSGNGRTLTRRTLAEVNPFFVYTPAWYFQNDGALVGDTDASIFMGHNELMFGIGMTNSYSIAIPGAISLECWAKTSGDKQNVFVAAITTSATPAHLILGSDTDGNATFYVAGFSNPTITTTVPVADGEWHHLVGTMTSDANQVLTLYVDGVQYAQITATGFSGVNPWNRLFIGATQATVDVSLLMDGAIDEVALYNKVLPFSSVEAHYKAGATPRVGETTGQRIDYLADYSGIPAAKRNIDTGEVPVQAVKSNWLNSSILKLMQDQETTENGALFFDAAGELTFFDSDHVDQAPYSQVSLLLGDRPNAAESLRLTGTAGNYASTPDSDAVSLQGTDQALAIPRGTNNRADTPGSSTFGLSADAEIRWEGYVDNFVSGAGSDQQYLLSNYGHNVSGFKLYLSGSTSDLRCQMSIAGSNAAVWAAHALAPGSKIRVKVVRTYSTGSTQIYAGAATTDWASLPALGAPAVIFAATTIPGGTASMKVGGGEGAAGLSGRATSAQLIVGGEVVASPDFTTTPWSVGQQSGTTGVDSTGTTWTLNGNAEIVATAERRSLRLSGASGVYASTPDSAALSITGDIDIRVKVALDDWTPAGAQILVAKRNAAQSYQFYVDTAGKLAMSGQSTAGTFSATSTVAPTVSDGAVLWVRVTRATATGTVTFYTSTDGSSFSALGATVATAAGTLLDTVDPLEIGANFNGSSNRLVGNVFYAEVRNGINGTIVANPDFGSRPWDVGESNGATGADSAGNTWTLNGSGAVIQRAYASDLDIRVKVALDDWTPPATMALLDKRSVNSSYQLRVETSGILTLSLSANNALVHFMNSGAAPGFSDGSTQWVRATFVASTGVATFYTSGDGVSWTTFATSPAGTGRWGFYDGTSPLIVGAAGFSFPLTGNVYYAEVRNGIDGTVVARFDPSSYVITSGSNIPSQLTSVTDAVWTISGTDWSWMTGNSEEPYRLEGLVAPYDDDDVWNEITITPDGLSPQISEDPTSKNDYGRRTKSLSTEHLNASDAKILSETLLLRYHSSEPRIEQVMVVPTDDPEMLFGPILGFDLLTKVQVRRRPMDGSGSVFDEEFYIEGIEHRVGKASWETTWRLSKIAT